MNPLVIFDYVYYSIAYLYFKKWGYGELKESYGVMLLSSLQALNLTTLIDYSARYIDITFKEFDILTIIAFCFVGSFVILYALNLLRYNKFATYDKLSAKWDKDKRLIRIVKSLLVICYFILSHIIFFNIS